MTASQGSADVFEISVPVATMWTSPDAPRTDIDTAAVLDVPDAARWTASMTAQVRKGLSGRTLTQLLLGEPVRILEERGDWVRATALWQPSSAASEGYPGWVRRAHLGAAVLRTDGPTAYVTAPIATCVVEGGATILLSFGTALWVAEQTSDHVEVLLPGGQKGRLSRDAVRISAKSEQPSYTPEDLLRVARKFLGLRYLWGGTSAWGLDCSGLVHLTYRSFGVRVPRDAFDQAVPSTDERFFPVPLDEVHAGDLYFFARHGERIYHVGFATGPLEPDGTRMMLHAPEGGELIEDAPMAPHRIETLVRALRPARTH